MTCSLAFKVRGSVAFQLLLACLKCIEILSISWASSSLRCKALRAGQNGSHARAYRSDGLLTSLQACKAAQVRNIGVTMSSIVVT